MYVLSHDSLRKSQRHLIVSYVLGLGGPRSVLEDSIDEETATQTLVFASDDYAEMKAARAEDREPKYRCR